MTRAYEILGLAPGATRGEARRAWKARIRETHPDRHGDKAAAHDLAAEINEAHDALMAILPEDPAPGSRPAGRSVQLDDFGATPPASARPAAPEAPKAKGPTSSRRRTGPRPAETDEAAKDPVKVAPVRRREAGIGSGAPGPDPAPEAARIYTAEERRRISRARDAYSMAMAADRGACGPIPARRPGPDTDLSRYFSFGDTGGAEGAPFGLSEQHLRDTAARSMQRLGFMRLFTDPLT